MGGGQWEEKGGKDAMARWKHKYNAFGGIQRSVLGPNGPLFSQ